MHKQIKLKELTAQDLPVLHDWFNSEVAFGDFDEPIPQSLETITQRYESGAYKSIRLMMHDHKPIGFVDCMIERKAPWIALIAVIITVPSYRGQGLGLQAHELLLEEIKVTKPEIKKIEAWTSTENFAEQKILTKLGFIQEGTFRSKVKQRGQLKDMICFGLLIH
jgi:RimJ/RimL family protein N-acetyltransferase